jgi:hypothetical protein
VAVLCGVLPLSSAGEDDSGDPVLQFYREKARITCADRHPVEQALSYSFSTKTYVKKLGRKGKITQVDSVTGRFFFHEGVLDSQQTEKLPSSTFEHLEFIYPNVFDSDYRFYFFPNDTGGPDLAIGFDSDSANDPRPVGLAIIDRDTYVLRRLYLFYPSEEGYKRYSRIFHFTELDGYIFPDTIYEVAAKAGFFSTYFYRRETIISDIKLSH